MVGSVVVYDGRVIGEGYHMQYGGAHAERNAIGSVTENDRHLLPKSKLYVSLEPCCHHGKTPPCTDLILSTGIREVYISAKDPNPAVSGKGMHLLRDHDVKVFDNILPTEGNELIRFFQTSMTKHRPHIILKIVQSADGFIGKTDKQVWLSNDYERVMVHKLRSEVDAILVGTNTAVLDNPELTTRFYPGRSPFRVLIDRTNRIPQTHNVLDGSAPTLIFTEHAEIGAGIPVRSGMDGNPRSTDSIGRATPPNPFSVDIVQCTFDDDLPDKILAELHTRRIQSILVEGGAELINTFLRKQLWDEALVVKTPKILESGIKAPLIEGKLKWRYEMAGDEVLAIVP